MTDELSDAEQGAVLEFQKQYLIGVPAARLLLGAHQLYARKADELREAVKLKGFPAENSPSAMELENVVACFYDVVEGVGKKISNACTVLKSHYPELCLPADDVIANSLLQDKDVDVVLRAYAEAKVDYTAKSDDEATVEKYVVEAEYSAAVEEESEPVAGVDSCECGADHAKGVSIDSALSEYYDQHEKVMASLMAGFPEGLREDVDTDIMDLFSRKVDEFAHGNYVNGVEHRLLEELENKGMPWYDDLYVRLKEEGKLDDASMQRVYIARFAARHRAKSREECNAVLGDECFDYRLRLRKKRTAEAKLAREKLSFLKKCLSTHRVWLDAFLEH